MVNESSPEKESKQPTAWDKLLESPDIQKAIAEIPKLISDNIKSNRDIVKSQFEEQAKVTRGVTQWTSVIVLIIVAIVVTAICWLAGQGKISTDAVTAILGAIVGGSFSFMMRIFRKD